jgi:eukaryotic-like serine/threonine-protein kinase
MIVFAALQTSSGSETPAMFDALAEPEPLAPGERVGRYEVLERVGAGSMGVVYAARDPELNRKVALKLLRHDRGEGPAQLAVETRLRREAQAMAKLQHPNVATVFDVGRHDGRVFVAMEFVEGPTLTRWLAQKKRPQHQTLDALLAAGRGLAAAHAAGLVHRDFKPDNVLCGDDGRVRVVDFGLARASSTPDEPLGDAPEPPLSGGALALTRTGALVGTPAYMAPEQWRGEPADAKSDQFSFCVTVYEALYGERPFADRLGAEAGRVREPPPDARVSGRLRRVLSRGLSASPEGRFPSLDALLVALEREPRRRWRRVAFAGGAALVAAAGGVYFAQSLGEQRLLCKGAERHLARVWDGARREAISAALLRTGVPYAEAAAREVSRVLDGYATRWAAQHTEACEATRVRGEQSEEIMGLRMACLDERRRELGALVNRLGEADRDVIEQAARAVHQLSGLEACADARALSTPVPPPDDPAARAEIEALRGRLADARSSYQTGKYREGLEAARPIAERAGQLHYRPLEAEALFLVGDLTEKLGDYEVAGRHFEQASFAAEAGQRSELAARSLIVLMRIEGRRRAHFDQADQLAPRVEVLLEQLGNPPDLEARYRFERGSLSIDRGRRDEADRSLKRALALLEAAPEPDPLRLAEVINALGHLSMRTEPPKSLVHFERALALQKSALGDEHPDVASTLANIGAAFYESHERLRGEAVYRQALAMRERTLGPEHHLVATSLHDLALICMTTNRAAEATALQRKALGIAEKIFGPENPNTIVYVKGLAHALEADDKPAEALPLFERALEPLRLRLGENHVRVAETLYAIGTTKMALGRLPEALAAVQQSRAIFLRVYNQEYREEGEVLRSLGDIYLRLGKRAQALASLEAALAAHRKYESDPIAFAQTNAILAQALWGSARDRDKARALAFEAYEQLKADPTLARERTSLERWMRARSML